MCLITNSNILAVYLLNLRRDLFASVRLFSLSSPWPSTCSTPSHCTTLCFQITYSQICNAQR